MSTPDAGWYPDETEPYLMRWFDGEAWTEDTAPLPAAAPEPEPAAVPSSMPAFVASGLPALVPVPAGGAVWYPDGAAPVEPETPPHADVEVPRHTGVPSADEGHRHVASSARDLDCVPHQGAAAHDVTTGPTAGPTAASTAVPTGRRAARLAAAALATPPVRPVGPPPPPPPPPPEPTTGLTAVPTGRRAARLAAAAQEAPGVVVARVVDGVSADVAPHAEGDVVPPAEVAPGLAVVRPEIVRPEIVLAPGALLIPTLEPWEEPPVLPGALVAPRPVPEPEVAPAGPWAAETSEPALWAAPDADPRPGASVTGSVTEAPQKLAPSAWVAPAHAAPAGPTPVAFAPVTAHPYAPPAPEARAPEGGWGAPQAFPGGPAHPDAPARPGNDPHDALHWIVPLGRSWQSIVAGYLGLVGLVLWPLAPVAAGLGAWAMVKARSGGHGRGRAVFAIVTGVAGTAFGVIALLSLGAVA